MGCQVSDRVSSCGGCQICNTCQFGGRLPDKFQHCHGGQIAMKNSTSLVLGGREKGKILQAVYHRELNSFSVQVLEFL